MSDRPPDPPPEHALPPDVLTLDEAAKLPRIDRDTVSRLIRTGVLPARNVSTGRQPRYRLSRAAVVRWLEEGDAPAPRSALAPFPPRQPRALRKTPEEREAEIVAFRTRLGLSGRRRKPK